MKSLHNERQALVEREELIDELAEMEKFVDDMLRFFIPVSCVLLCSFVLMLLYTHGVFN